MSYPRRGGNFGKQNTPLSTVGQRRPQGNQFGGGGPQLTNNKNYRQPGFQNKQQNQQNQQQQQQQPQPHFQPPPLQQDKPKPPQQPVIQQNQPRTPGPPTPILKPQQQQQQQSPVPQQPIQQQQQQPIQQQQPAQPPTPSQLVANAQQLVAEFGSDAKPLMSTDVTIPGLGNGSDSENATPQQRNRPFWMKKNGRINKAERAKRRNVRLRKLLQPKNALMIINELVGHVAFELSEAKNNFEDVYKALVVVEGSEFTGLGKSKAIAKTAAAESAVRSMILNKLRITASLPPPNEEDNKDVKMEVTEENQEDVSWTHIASFAIHKLFSSWGDDGNMADMMTRTNSYASLHDTSSIKDGSVSGLQTQPEQKPAKKLPENAIAMNPIMLLNQMHPSAKYEELGKSGNPPHVQFTMRCQVNNQSFVGLGSNKKTARKQAAYEACKTLLNLQYPPEILDGSAPKVTAMETQ